MEMCSLFWATLYVCLSAKNSGMGRAIAPNLKGSSTKTILRSPWSPWLPGDVFGTKNGVKVLEVGGM